MNELQQLETKIRQALPRLQELSDGCVIISKTYGIAKLIYYDNEYYDFLFVDSKLQYRRCNENDITIIGHNIYLSDVLEWIDKQIGSLSYYHIDNTCVKILLSMYDLSKPLLKDQPKEVIEYLNNLK